MGVDSYAHDAGLTVDALVEGMGTILSPLKVAMSVARLCDRRCLLGWRPLPDS